MDNTIDMVNELHTNFNLAVSHARAMMDTLGEVNKMCLPKDGDDAQMLFFKLGITNLIRDRVTKL